MDSIKSEDEKTFPIKDEELREWVEQPESKEDVILSKEEAKASKYEVNSDEYASDEKEEQGNTVLENQLPRDVIGDSSHNNVGKLGALDSVTRKLCPGSPVSGKVASLCRYKCTVCCKPLLSWNSIRNHFIKEHADKKVVFADLENLFSDVVCHVCKVCSAYVLCDLTFISRHLRKHNMIISQYVDKFGVDASKKLPEITYSENVIGNLCEYKCDDCGRKFIVRDCFAKHIKVSHGRISRSREGLVKRVFHKCKLCEKPIVCQMEDLVQHYKLVHNITYKEYCEQTGCKIKEKVFNNFLNSSDLFKSLKLSNQIGNLCVFVCQTCSKKFSYSVSLQSHYKKVHQHSLANALVTSLVKGFSYKCKKCSRIMLCDKAIIHTHMIKTHFPKDGTKTNTSPVNRKLQYEEMCNTFLRDIPVSQTVGEKTLTDINNIPIEQVTSIIGNLCQFKCPTCEYETFPNWNLMKRHYTKIHEEKLGYKPSLVSVARYHACLLCPRAVLSDRQLLTFHLNWHGKGLPDYERIFRKHGGRTLPTYSKWMKEKCNLSVT